MSHPDSNPPTSEDPFDTLLSLEDQYFTEGYELGVADGSRAGRIEGRVFGLEKGFEKALQMGRLAGRASVWKTRLSEPSSCSHDLSLAGSERLRKHVDRLVELTEAESLETRNTEDDVNEFDERLAGARAKAMLISKVVGEDDAGVGKARVAAKDPETSSQDGREVEVTRPGSSQRRDDGGKKTGEMEDFIGLPNVRKTG